MTAYERILAAVGPCVGFDREEHALRVSALVAEAKSKGVITPVVAPREVRNA